jgi:hypothetical protein
MLIFLFGKAVWMGKGVAGNRAMGAIAESSDSKRQKRFESLDWGAWLSWSERLVYTQ